MIDLLKDHPRGEPVPAISLREPWAAAVAFLGKDVENRSRWPFEYRGPILIHASKTQMELKDCALLRSIAEEEGFSEEELADLDPESESFAAGIFGFGEIVAVAMLSDVFSRDDDIPEDHPAEESPWADDKSEYWLYFSEVVPVLAVEFNGAEGMFKVPYAIAAELKALESVEESEE
jgi:hypothetical protein